jgi:hypothetical protein
VIFGWLTCIFVVLPLIGGYIEYLKSKIAKKNEASINIQEFINTLKEMSDPAENFHSRFLVAESRPAFLKAVDLNPESIKPQALQIIPTCIMYCWDILCMDPDRFNDPLEADKHYFGFAVEDWARVFSLIQFINNRAARIFTKPKASDKSIMVYVDLATGDIATTSNALVDTNPDAGADQTEPANVLTRSQQQLIMVTTAEKMQLVRNALGFKADKFRLKFVTDVMTDVGKEALVGRRDTERAAKRLYCENLITTVLTCLPKDALKRNIERPNPAPVLSLNDCARFIENLQIKIEKMVCKDEGWNSLEDIMTLFKAARGSTNKSDSDQSLDPLAELGRAAQTLNNMLDTSNTDAHRSENFETTVEQQAKESMELDPNQILTSEVKIVSIGFVEAMKILHFDLDAYYATKEDPNPYMRNIVRFRDFSKVKSKRHAKDIGLKPGQVVGM